jgi:hypothetical protein
MPAASGTHASFSITEYQECPIPLDILRIITAKVIQLHVLGMSIVRAYGTN